MTTEPITDDELEQPDMEPCSKCGQVDHGQWGEYPCSVCGLPLVWDAPEPEPEGFFDPRTGQVYPGLAAPAEQAKP